MKTYVIQNEGHTVASLLRNDLLKKSRFASCIVKHPQDTCLVVQLSIDEPDVCLINTIVEKQEYIHNIIKTIKKSTYYDNSMDVS
jgi:DNA-directed RNA polymerase subunit L